MKEVTYEDWQKNPTLRMMWVWDDYEEDKKKMKVLYIVTCETFPVIATTPDNKGIFKFLHCAEIEKQRRMTNKELARWLREKPTREYKYKKATDDYTYSYYDYIYSYYEYKECCADEELDDLVFIRENDGEWREPLVEEGING